MTISIMALLDNGKGVRFSSYVKHLEYVCSLAYRACQLAYAHLYALYVKKYAPARLPKKTHCGRVETKELLA